MESGCSTSMPYKAIRSSAAKAHLVVLKTNQLKAQTLIIQLIHFLVVQLLNTKLTFKHFMQKLQKLKLSERILMVTIVILMMMIKKTSRKLVYLLES